MPPLRSLTYLLSRPPPRPIPSMKRKHFLQFFAGAASTIPFLRASGAEKPAGTAATNPERKPLPPLPEGAWTLVDMPDTQSMALHHPKVLRHQTEWIAAQRNTYNIKFVIQKGDIVDRNSHPEWMNVRHAFDALLEAKIPFAILPGNHDIGRWGRSDDRNSHMSDYFTNADYRNSVASGYFARNQIENSWHRVVPPTGKLLVVALEFGPRDAVLEWADGIVAQNSDHDVVVATHAYLYHDSTRYDWAKKGDSQTWNPKGYPIGKIPGEVNDAEDMWTKFVSRHRNIRFVLSGHVLRNGTGYLVSEGVHGNRVHQILANYQSGVVPDRGFGGAGLTRLMHFLPDKKTVEVRTYSPWLDQWLNEPDQAFTITL